MSVTDGTSSGVAKWQLALVVGAPVALGLGYMYYKKNVRTNSKPDRHGKPKENGASTDKQISIENGDVDGNQVPSSAPKQPETPLEEAQRYKKEGNAYFKIGKYDKAIAQYNTAIEICPALNVDEVATFYQNRAAAYEQLGKYDSVKMDCTKAIELKPRYVKALLRRARALEQMGDLESALEDVTATCIYESFSNQSSLQLADKLLKQLGKQHVHENLQNKKFIMPSKHFIKTYMVSFPNDPVFSRLQHPLEDIPELYKNLLQTLKDEKYDDVIPLCTDIIASAEFDTLSCKMEILLLRTTFYLLLGQHTSAFEDLDVIINDKNVPKNVILNALIKKATLYMQLENPDMAVKGFEAAINLDETYGDIYHHSGQMHLLLNNVDEAKRDFEKAARYNPSFGPGHVQKCYTDYRYAIFYRDINALQKAEKDFMEALEKYPDRPEGYMLCGQMMAESQDYEKADTYFAKALEIDPENANVYVHRGLLQLQWHGNTSSGIDKAVEYIHKALEIDEKCELGYETLGTIEVQRGNLEEAIKLFDKALELCRTSMELTHLYSLRDATKTQLTLKNKLGLDIKDAPNVS
ncbi:mitochondrial import receptor subunit TOM70 [Harpegnathos saltator]|uniref:Mitochondrial import receptor subunit TOM70 n=1 Tax=Harpegnathos saltator TaxID=610380 RepID=E2C6L7_HARSA|nr:mitochondrial import receptor subunit TOM70 [Harpegnathos saltator]EFN76419.1 Mitochondrial import receptor subunit TOM70 [Harpegnathos saltator]